MLLKERTYATQSIEAVKQLIAYDHNGQVLTFVPGTASTTR